MQKGVDAATAIRTLLRERGWKIVDLAAKTGISANTLALYATENEKARRKLGLQNGAKIAKAFGVDLSRLGLSEGAAADDELTNLRLAHAALEETVRLLTGRVEALERRRAAPRRVAATQKRKAV